MLTKKGISSKRLFSFSDLQIFSETDLYLRRRKGKHKLANTDKKIPFSSKCAILCLFTKSSDNLFFSKSKYFLKKKTLSENLENM